MVKGGHCWDSPTNFQCKLQGDKNKVWATMQKQSKKYHKLVVSVEVTIEESELLKKKTYEGETLAGSIPLTELNPGAIWKVPMMDEGRKDANAQPKAKAQARPKAKAKAKAKARN